MITGGVRAPPHPTPVYGSSPRWAGSIDNRDSALFQLSINRFSFPVRPDDSCRSHRHLLEILHAADALPGQMFNHMRVVYNGPSITQKRPLPPLRFRHIHRAADAVTKTAVFAQMTFHFACSSSALIFSISSFTTIW
jgi:hypothetical protein